MNGMGNGCFKRKETKDAKARKGLFFARLSVLRDLNRACALFSTKIIYRCAFSAGKNDPAGFYPFKSDESQQTGFSSNRVKASPGGYYANF